MRLERELFSSPEFANFSEAELVLLKVDFPSRKRNDLSDEQRRHNEALAEEYNKNGAFPLVVITDAEGSIKGFMDHPLTSAQSYLASLEALIGKQ